MQFFDILETKLSADEVSVATAMGRFMATVLDLSFWGRSKLLEVSNVRLSLQLDISVSVDLHHNCMNTPPSQKSLLFTGRDLRQALTG